MLVDLSLDHVSRVSNYSKESEAKRVTEILGYIGEESLMYWANGLGFKGISYKKELSRYATIGTKVHSEIEKFLSGDRDLNTINPDDYTQAGFYAFISWYDEQVTKLGKNIEILGLEQSFEGKYFRGTIDCIMRIDGKLYLVDFKTSSHIGYKYFMQLAAYEYLWSKAGNEPVFGFMVIQLNRDNPSKYTTYTLDSIDGDNVYLYNLLQDTFFKLTQVAFNVDELKGVYK